MQIKTFPVTFVWADQTIEKKRLVLEIEEKSKSYEIDEIKDKEDLVVKRKIGSHKEKRHYYVSVITTGYFKEIEIRSK